MLSRLLLGQMYTHIHAEWSQRHPVRRSRLPIIAGPWLGEVGPELQYWIPWLQALVAQGVFEQRRLIIVSRGGADAWYQNLTRDYVDFYDVADLSVLHRIRKDRTTEKQLRWTADERSCISAVAERLGLKDYETIHPSQMWHSLLPYFQERASVEWMLQRLTFKAFTIDQPPVAAQLLPDMHLPSNYIVVRFYVSELFPHTPENVQFVKALLEQLSQQTAVIALVNQQQLDDHGVFTLPTLPNLTTVVMDQSLRTNLLLQTQVIAKAKAFFGTYGGLTVLPGLLRKPCFGFIGNVFVNNLSWHFRHEPITQYLYQTVAQQPYNIQSIKAWQLSQRLLGFAQN